MKLLLDYGTILAFVMFSAGNISQTRKVFKRRSSADIALLDLALRFLASIILFIKVIDVGDAYLIIGQSISFLIFFFYCTIATKYRHGCPDK